jgi:hypothetical protein
MKQDPDPREVVREYVIEIGGVDYRWNRRAITVPDLRALAGIEHELPMLLIDGDNNVRLLVEDEVIWRPGTYRFRPRYPEC